ncbi:5'-nucleotidase [Promicromonospora sp. AC04]|uniref:bifunctional metallophosphatase/5'-nucleotidase n=1 Tax=Promicromonospora sp. AC04 TaxID=2135723 RepID=UPI000D3D5CE4|nr:5'-nucleotidase C-terminal domain-containing protein [Promicromonospora sp. AC04]PUB32137.1 5'-nucleotidase [Promicromonospora sp. AC04]
MHRPLTRSAGLLGMLVLASGLAASGLTPAAAEPVAASPAAGVSAADLAVPEVSAAELPGTELPAAEAPAAEQPAMPASRHAKPAATLLYFHDAHEIGPVLTGGEDRGGVARLATAVRTVERRNPATSVVFGGDLAGGTLFGGLYQGVPMVDALNEVGVDLANFGQHDFDFGVDHTRELVAASDFPWITSNLTETDGSPFVEGGTWAVQRVGRVRVGFVGLTDAIETTSAAGDLIETDPVEATRAAVADLKAHARVDVVVAVTQYPMDENHELVRAVPELDAVFGEEMAEYESVIEYEGDVPLMASEGNIGSLIRLDISEERGKAPVAEHGTARGGHRPEYRVRPSVVEVDHTVTPDPELREVEERYAAEMDERLSEVLAGMRTPLLDPTQASRSEETALGNFVADAFREQHQADVGWVNGGGLRAEAPGPDFTLRDAYSIAPFSNRVMNVRVTGAGLLRSLEDAVSRVADAGGGFPQVSGMAYAYSPTAAVGSRVSDVSVGGQPLDPDATYTVAATNYVIGGGDGVSGFADAEVLVPIGDAPVDAEVIADHARALGTIDITTEGRITVLP